MGLANILYDMGLVNPNAKREDVEEDIRRAGLAVRLATKERIDYKAARAQIDKEADAVAHGNQQSRASQAYDAP